MSQNIANNTLELQKCENRVYYTIILILESSDLEVSKWLSGITICLS